MSPNLQRCMKQARDYPNTATVDILIAAIEKEFADAVAAEREGCAELISDYLSKWANDMDEEEAEDLRDLRDLIRQRGSDCEHCRAEAMSDNERKPLEGQRQNTGTDQETQCPTKPPS